MLMAKEGIMTGRFLIVGCTMWVIVCQGAHIREVESVIFYHRNGHCSGQVLREDLRYDDATVRSKAECAGACLADTDCHSFLYDPHGNRCSRGMQPSSDDCSNMVPAEGIQHYDVKTSCYNGGRLNTDGICVCPKGYMGDNCATPLRDCHHGYYDGRLRKHGVYWILPTRAQRPFKVYCHLKGARPRTYIMNRIDNSATISFDRKWADYQRGFGDPEADFWLGLDNIHVLTYSEVYHVRFRIRQLNPEQNLYQQYYHVRVASGDDLYRVTFDDNTTAGNLGDSFSPSNGAKFSTADNDNDGNANVNCAALHKAGWWFKDSTCSLCNPTGPLLRSGDGKVSNAPGEAFWTFDLGDTAPHKISIYLVNF